MSLKRRTRREQERNNNTHYAYLGELLGGYYEFLSGYEVKTLSDITVEKNPDTGLLKPTNEQIRAEFKARNEKWAEYCAKNQLMQAEHLFTLNVSEAWKRKAQVQSDKE